MDGREEEMLWRVLSGVFRIIITIICVKKAKKLNRNAFGWGVFGLFLPLIAIIWIQFMKPKTRWEEEK